MIRIEYNSNSQFLFDGLLRSIYNSTNRINYFSIVSSSESSIRSGRTSSAIIIDPEATSSASSQQFVTDREENSNVTISLSGYSIQLHSYSLKSRTDTIRNTPLSWVLEGSVDGLHWNLIHNHPYGEEIIDIGSEYNFPVSSKNYFTLFRFTQTGVNAATSTDDSTVFSLNKVEFFGCMIHSLRYATIDYSMKLFRLPILFHFVCICF